MIRKIEYLFDHKPFHLLTGIFLIGAVLRLYHINYQSLWLDELYSIVPTDPKNSLLSVIEYCKGDQPPLFFIYIHSMFKVFGYNETVGRIASALVGLMGIAAIYLLGKECFGRREGIFAALLTSINYFHIYYSQELRFYSMAFLFATLSYLFYIRAFRRVALVDYLAYGISTICLLYTHYFGLIILGTQVAVFFILLIYKRDLRFIFLSVMSCLLVLLAFIPWLPILFNDMGVDVGWIKKPEPYFVAQYFYDYTGKDALTTIVLIAFIYLTVKNTLKKSIGLKIKIIVLIITAWIVLSYLVPYIRSVTLSPMLHNRYTIVTLPAWIILFAFGWEKIRMLKWKYALIPILIVSSILNLFFFRQHYYILKKEQYREASEIVLAKNKSAYPVYSSLSWHFSFYFRNSTTEVRDFQSADFTSIDKFWLLQAHITEEEMEAEVLRLKDSFRVAERNLFFGSNAILMERW